jgi:large subunit ribosomal protein L21
MYAVIKTGGKQYRVSPGDTLRVELLPAEAGDQIALPEVLMIGDGDNITVGTPLITNAVVNATVQSHGRADKVRIVKFRRRKHYRKRAGHRQHFTLLHIDTIVAG